MGSTAPTALERVLVVGDAPIDVLSTVGEPLPPWEMGAVIKVLWESIPP